MLRLSKLFALKKVREDRRCWGRNYNLHALRNLRRRIQAGHKIERSVELSHRSCPHGKLHGQQSDGTQNRTANAPSTERYKLPNDLNKGHWHQSDKSLNQQASLASPYKSAKRFEQGDAREITKEEAAHRRSQVKELLKIPHSEFDRLVGLINAVTTIMAYHVTNNSCGTGMKKSVSPGSVNTGDRDVGAIQASYIRDDLQKQHQSATTIQKNYRGYQTRKHLMKSRESSNYKVTSHVDSSRSSSQSPQGHSIRSSSRSPCLIREYDTDSAIEYQRRVQMGKLIQPRLAHDGGTTSRDTSLKTTKETSPRYDDVVSSHGLGRSGMNGHFLVDPAKKEAVVTIQAGYRGYRARNDFRKKRQSATTIQTNYRGYQTRKHLKKSRDEHDIVTFQDESSNYKVTSHVDSSRSSSRSPQGHSIRSSSRSPCLIREYERVSAREDRHRVQTGKLIRPRWEHDGGTSRDTSLKTTKTTSPCYDDVVSSHGLDRSGMNGHFLVDPVKEEAVVTIQAGYRGYRARNDFRKKRQSATTIQKNYRGYQTRKHLMKSRDEHDIVTFQDEPADYKVASHVDSSRSSSRSPQGHSSKPSSRSPCLIREYERVSAREDRHRVQMGKLIQPRLGHDGGTSRDTSLKTTKTTSPRHYDVVFFHGLDSNGMNGRFLVDPAKEEAVVTIQAGYRGSRARNDFRKKRQSATTIQANYRGYQTRKHLKKRRDEHDIVTFQDEPVDYKVTNHVDSSQSSSQSPQGYSSKPSSRSPCLSPTYDRDSALEDQRRVQLGKLIRPRLGHDGGTSRDTSLKTTKTTSPRYYDVVFFHGLDSNGMNGHFLVDPAKEEAVVTIQAGYRGSRARNDFRKKRQSATTIQANYRGYQTRKHLMKRHDEHGIVTFQDEPADYKVTNHVDSSQSSSHSSQGYSSKPSSRSPCLSPKYDRDSVLEDQHRVQLGKLIRPRLGHDGGTSRDTSLKTTKTTSPRYYDVVFFHGLDSNGMNGHFLVDPAKEEAVVTIQAGYRGSRARNDFRKKRQSATTIQKNYRGYQTRKHLKKTRDEHDIVTFQDESSNYKVTSHVDSSRSSSRSSQGCSIRPSSRSPCLIREYDTDSAIEYQRRVQLGKLIQPRSEHDGGTTSRDTTLKTTKTTSPRYYDVVFFHGLDSNGMNGHFLVDPAKEEAVITIQAGYRGYRARNDFRKKRQSATTIQKNYRGYQTRKHLKKSRDEHDIVTFQDESSNYKVTSHVDSSRSSSRSSQGCSIRPSSRSPCLIREYDTDSAIEYQRRVQLGKLIQPRSEHDGGTTSRDTTLKTTKTTSPRYYDVVFFHGLDSNGMNGHFLVDPAKEEAVITIQAGYRGYRARNDFRKKRQSATTIQKNYRGYQTRKHLKKSRDEHDIVTFQDESSNYKVTSHVDSSRSSSRSSQGCSIRPSSRSPCLIREYDTDSAIEYQRRVQLGKFIQPRSEHDGGTTSRDTTLKTTKTTSPRYYDVVFFHGLNSNGMNGHFLVDPAKEEAVITIQAGYRGYRVRNDFRKKRQSATTIQTNYRGYQTRKHLKKSRDEHDIGHSSRLSSQGPCLIHEYDTDSAIEDQRRVQRGKLIRPRSEHDGGTSRDTSLKTTKTTSPCYDDVVSSHGLDRSGMNGHFLVDPVKEEAVVTIQAGYRGYRARNDFRKKRQSATTIQVNNHGYKLSKDREKSPIERITSDDDLDAEVKISAFHIQEELNDIMKGEVKVDSSKAPLRRKLGEFEEPTSRAPVKGSQDELPSSKDG
uniref:abnormal spindle-like microcephaly-associated protein homolog n=1 Tax=Myxine glutinosa TaxID=7769 RepID=UPI00358E0A83